MTRRREKASGGADHNRQGECFVVGAETEGCA